MCASPGDFLRAGPPPPRVALLPDSVFFSRAVPVAPGATRAEVVAQVGRRRVALPCDWGGLRRSTVLVKIECA